MRGGTGAVLLTLLAVQPCLAAELPDWLRRVLSGPVPETQEAATVLLDESQVRVAEDGKVVTLVRYAVRINAPEGRTAAALRHVYVNPAGKVKSNRGWIVDKAGVVREIGDQSVIDIAAVNNDVYNEVRVRLVSSDAVAEGSVFSAEIEAEERVPFLQFEWSLQHHWPVRLARRSVLLPRGWSVTGRTFNAPAIEPIAATGGFTWEARDLPSIAEEAEMPPVSSLAARLAVSVFEPDPAPRANQFRTWEQVAAWLHTLSNTGPPSPPIASRARELTQTAAEDYERVRTIARYVQRIPYVSIQTGLGRGGGYQPRPPDVVLAKNYGDCKDKASLMRALLAAVGVQSYPVFLFAGDRDYVREEWPSPQQFNHAIVAVAVQHPVADATIEHETLGRLLIFDPTDEDTRLGELPFHEQGSLALIAAPAGGLRRLPMSSPDSHGILRDMDAALDARGGLTVKIRETRLGADATARRALRRSMDPGTYRQAVERRITTFLPGARLIELTPAQNDVPELVTHFEAFVPNHAQRTGSLLIVKPLVGFEPIVIPAATGRRQHPFVQQPVRCTETVRMKLPPEVRVDELPQSVAVSTTFGSFSLAYMNETGTVVVRRELELPLKRVPVSDLPHLREFLEKIRDADQSPIVLVTR